MKYNDIRRKTRCVKIKDVIIGGDNDIAIQSMTNTDTLDKASTLEQIKKLEGAGCDIVRITVPTVEAAQTISYLKLPFDFFENHFQSFSPKTDKVYLYILLYS